MGESAITGPGCQAVTGLGPAPYTPLPSGARCGKGCGEACAYVCGEGLPGGQYFAHPCLMELLEEGVEEVKMQLQTDNGKITNILQKVMEAGKHR